MKKNRENMISFMLGQKIKLPDYTPEQQERWVMEDCPAYTGIMAAVNNISKRRFDCFIDNLDHLHKQECFDEAARIGLAWIEIPE